MQQIYLVPPTNNAFEPTTAAFHASAPLSANVGRPGHEAQGSCGLVEVLLTPRCQ